MRKIYLLLIISVFNFAVYAQQDTTLVYASPGYMKDPIRSKLKQVVTHTDSSHILSLYDKKQILQEKITFADEKLTERRGSYLLYEGGSIKAEGIYNRGYKVGDWTYYQNGKLSEKVHYTWGKKHGKYKRYWENGQLKEEADYDGDKFSGNRTMYYQNGVVALKEVYDAGKKVASSYFDTDGNATKITSVVQPPSFPGGMKAFYEFLGKEMRYPADARKNGISGTVRLSFTVGDDGRIDNIKVIDSPDESLSKEAIRVLRYNVKWNPGMELGEPVKMNYAIPIRFSLGNN